MKQILTNDLKYVVYGCLIAIALFALLQLAPIWYQHAIFPVASSLLLAALVIPAALQLWKTVNKLSAQRPSR